MKNAAKVFHVLLALAVAMLSQGTAIADVITYYHTDLAGSPVAGSDVNGNIVWREAYTPYGERRLEQATSGSNRRWFTGQPHEEFTGLTYMGARHYDPMIGRFMGMDPMGPDLSRIQFGFNRYAYANDDPFDWSDALGLDASLTKLKLTKEEYVKQAKTLWKTLSPDKGSGFRDNNDVKSAAATAEARPSASTANVEASAEQRSMAAGIAKATASARIGGQDQDYERAVTIGTADGAPVVTSMQILGKQGASLLLEGGDAVAHLHYNGLVQPPNNGDFSPAKNGVVSFVFGATGKTWEVGRQDGNYVQRPISSDGTPGKWRPFGSEH